MQSRHTRETRHTTRRPERPSLNPYTIDEIAPTLSDIRAARSGRRTH